MFFDDSEMLLSSRFPFIEIIELEFEQEFKGYFNAVRE